MAKRSDLEAQIAALQQELESAEDDGEDVELWVEHERNGKAVKTRLSGSHASSWLADLLGNPAEEKGAEKGAETAETKVEETIEVKSDARKPQGGGSYFSRK